VRFVKQLWAAKEADVYYAAVLFGEFEAAKQITRKL
jgi:hypothetical protein